MPTWKIVYDCRRPTWIAFGRVVFVEAADATSARTLAERVIPLREPPGMTISDLSVVPSTPAAWRAHDALRVAQRRWQANVAAGIPNDRRVL